MTIEKEIFGYLGAFFLTITLLPQLWHTYKNKKMDDVSYGFLGIQVITCSLFLTYGILLEELPLILANVIVLIQTFLLINFKFIYSYRVTE
jgi:MtN3 and saliva related transmembrane protein|tara:strand:- start:139 stop:411 length:273 start_codon:yes stop_codon:yes gene_type:complete